MPHTESGSKPPHSKARSADYGSNSLAFAACTAAKLCVIAAKLCASAASVGCIAANVD